MTPRRDMTFVERMIRVTNVAWGRKPEGGFWVVWNEDRKPRSAEFDTAFGAEQFARWLDTTGTITETSVRSQFKELEALERGLYTVDEERRRELEELGVPMASQREQRRAGRMLTRVYRPVRVRRYWRQR